MAKMIPPFISDDVVSKGEIEIFHLFKNCPETDSWIVLHSLNLVNHSKRLYGEIDFLVMAPELGIFCFEVKSGYLKREKGLWKYSDKYNKERISERGPFKQAQEGMFSIKKAITEKYNLPDLLYNYGAMFPYIDFDIESTEYESWQVYDKKDRQFPISHFIREFAENSRRKVQHCTWFDPETSLPSRKDVERIANFLRGDFEILVKPVHYLGYTEERINKYTEEQYKCLDQLESNSRCVFYGAAGTGKTMIAMESVKRSIFNNQRTLFICYNRLLSSWLRNCFQKELNRNNHLVVDNFYNYISQLASIDEKIGPDVPRDDTYYNITVPSLVLETILNENTEPFDKLIIDEGQDLIKPRYLDIFDGLLKGGLKKGKWEIYSDLERQAIFSEFTSDDMLNMLEERANFAKFKLTVNCRNTKEIGRDVSIITGYDVPPFLPSTIEGVPVEYLFYNRHNHTIKLEGILKKLKDQNIPSSGITILSPYKFTNSI